MLPEKKLFRPRRESMINRGVACSLAPTQPERAFAIAATIPDGWYRCQAMTAIARAAPEPLSEKAFAAARAAAAAGEDTYQQAAVLAGTLYSAIECRRPALATAIFHDILKMVPNIEPMGSRAAALSWLWTTVHRAGTPDMRQTVIDLTVAHCHPDRSWRAVRLYRQIVANLAWDRPDAAEKLIAAMPHGKARARVTRRRAEGEKSRN
ncbi:MAG: hypothetical protein JWN71_5049 [Xanthobacteraceae bacterium]|nr:hypothetical protein [Xanthobacteraceae bacterium]